MLRAFSTEIINKFIFRSDPAHTVPAPFSVTAAHEIEKKGELIPNQNPEVLIRNNIVACLCSRHLMFIHFFNGQTLQEKQIFDKEFLKAKGLTPQDKEKLEKIKPIIFILGVRFNELLNKHNAVKAFQYTLRGDPYFIRDETGRKLPVMRRFAGLLESDTTLLNFFFDTYPDIYLFFLRNIENFNSINNTLLEVIYSSKLSSGPQFTFVSHSPQFERVTFTSSSKQLTVSGTSYRSTIKKLIAGKTIQYETETAPTNFLEQIQSNVEEKEKERKAAAKSKLAKRVVNEIKAGHDYQDAFAHIVKRHKRETTREEIKAIAEIDHEDTLVALFLRNRHKTLGAFFDDYVDSIEKDKHKQFTTFFNHEAESVISVSLGVELNITKAFEDLLGKYGFKRRMTPEAAAYHTARLKMDSDTNSVVRSFFNLADESTTLGEFFDAACQRVLYQRSIAETSSDSDNEDNNTPESQRSHSVPQKR